MSSSGTNSVNIQLLELDQTELWNCAIKLWLTVISFKASRLILYIFVFQCRLTMQVGPAPEDQTVGKLPHFNYTGSQGSHILSRNISSLTEAGAKLGRGILHLLTADIHKLVSLTHPAASLDRGKQTRTVGKLAQANKTALLWGANCVQPSDSRDGNKVKLLLVSLPGFHLVKVMGHVAWM